MKFTLMGFSQQGLINLGLDTIDAMLLRYFVDFKATKRMKAEIIEDKLFFWVNYDNVLKEFPILNMKKRTIQTRFLKLRDAGVLTHYVKKEGGTYSFFGIGSGYEELIAQDNCKEYQEEKDIKGGKEKKAVKETQDQTSSLKEDKGFVTLDPSSFNEYPSSLDGQGSQLKLLTNNPSTKDSSTINNTTSSKKRGCAQQEKQISEIIGYLNEVTGKKFKPDTKVTERHITARLKEGFTVEEFKLVIDNMVYNWTGTRFQQYLAPATLFSIKFETYLHGGKVEKDKRDIGDTYGYPVQSRALRNKESCGPKPGNVAALRTLCPSEEKKNLSGAEGSIEELKIVFGEEM